MDTYQIAAHPSLVTVWKFLCTQTNDDDDDDDDDVYK